MRSRWREIAQERPGPGPVGSWGKVPVEGSRWGSQTAVMTGLLRDQSVGRGVGSGPEWAGGGRQPKQERVKTGWI